MELEVTYEQVWAAADALQAEGKEVSNATVRHRMGDVGHFQVINEAMEMWRSGYRR